VDQKAGNLLKPRAILSFLYFSLKQNIPGKQEDAFLALHLRSFPASVVSSTTAVLSAHIMTSSSENHPEKLTQGDRVMAQTKF
jgi:hypothetical protein